MLLSKTKLQIRAQVINLLVKYSTNPEINPIQLQKDLDNLTLIENKDYLCELILKELKNASGEYEQLCAIFFLELIPNEIAQNHAFNFLAADISDEKKFFFISILKQKGLEIDHSDLEKYINSPNELAQASVKNFLQNAKNNLEVQIDLLDFYSNITPNEQEYFLNNISSNYDEDDYINAISLISYVELNKTKQEEFLNILLSSENVYALKALEEYQKKENNPKIIQKIKRKIQKIKLKNQTPPPELYLKNSKINKCYIGNIDGRNEFPIIFSRKNNNGTYELILMTINTQLGIVATVGFSNADDDSFLTILSRIFNNSQMIKINPIALKSIYNFYKNKNYKTNTQIPYEALVWEKLLNDVRQINYSLSKFINSKLEPIELTNKRLANLFSNDIFETWFYTYNQNIFVDEIINEIEIMDKIELETIEKLMIQNISKNVIYDKNYINDLIEKLMLQAYISKLGKRTITSSTIFSLCQDKQSLILFIISMFRKSIYQYFLNRKALFKNKEDVINFKKPRKTKLTLKILDDLINKIEAKWKLETE